jgi:hypothetical protein
MEPRTFVCASCGYDYCICGSYGPMVPPDQLSPAARVRHLRTVIATMEKARAPDQDIEAMRRELQAAELMPPSHRS